ncbi:hypothetical protein [Tabrizicola aquatica]|uniref:hypothetical protein n=1 Tax=Tabrizicola aquatica TaxID=909926 RepID=UPI0011AF5741|nr:hypothetical protein [Tabrizicola aquatica]
MKRLVVASIIFLFCSSVLAQVNSLVTDGKRPFSEGVLKGYIVQNGNKTLCKDPYVIGQHISCAEEISIDGNHWKSESKKQVWVDTNGVLGAMIVVDAKGRVICRDPMVSLQFRGPDSYIFCQN